MSVSNYYKIADVITFITNYVLPDVIIVNLIATIKDCTVTSLIKWSPPICITSVWTNSTVFTLMMMMIDDDVFTLNECKPTTNDESSSLNSYTKCHYIINLTFIAMEFIDCH